MLNAAYAHAGQHGDCLSCETKVCPPCAVDECHMCEQDWCCCPCGGDEVVA